MTGASGRTVALVFDVNETLLDIESLTPLFARVFGDGATMREWFAQLVLYSQTITLASAYVPFDVIGAAVLRMLGAIKHVAVTDRDVAELGERMRTMSAHEDVAPALERLKAAGFRLATLTNSPPAPDGGALRRADLDRFFEHRLSVDSVRRFKPAPETYDAVVRALEISPDGLCLVAAHVWDVLGARLFGAEAALILRSGNADLSIDDLPHPTIVARDMADFADAAIARWSA